MQKNKDTQLDILFTWLETGFNEKDEEEWLFNIKKSVEVKKD